jgi:hypothetical protein
LYFVDKKVVSCLCAFLGAVPGSPNIQVNDLDIIKITRNG